MFSGAEIRAPDDRLGWVQPTVSQTDGSSGELLPTRATLLERLQNREGSETWQQGWQEFFTLYQPVIYRFAINSGLKPGEADEVVQEVVIGVARKLPAFRYEPERCTFKTWLFRVVRNKIVDHRRREKTRGRRPDSGGISEEEYESIPDEGMLTPDRAWDLEFERGLRQSALQWVSQRVKPMTLRLYLHHVVDGHDVEATVAAFRDSNVVPADVYQAKFRVQAKLDAQLLILRRGTMAA